ncbi:thymidylate synthase [Erysipelothrix sp. HDW6C]|uniref:thymidylate synthase n=1 Tax=Erysipelothrix sp. HDW6C TaxID=2714930 RepID=UPI0014082FF1|nr:thymidylate synthase [Erysipelothrix sp. HDW6C]QIK70188.1 thymidylate synthase [Erysipelothrix sp. HDW6C]
MKNYLDMMRYVLENGDLRDDRTGTGTKGVFGYQMRHDLSQGFPLLTTKKVHFASVAKELLWFISGDTNIQWLVNNNVRIWNEWPYQKFTKSEDYQGETLADFVELIKSDDAFAKKHGDLGPVYGKQWRDFNGVDQLATVIDQIKNNPTSRRIILNAWNPAELEDMALPPCHAFLQFYVSGNKLSLQLYQRSADIFLGVPFNIASYALMVHMIAHVCDLEVGEFVHTFGDLHIYQDHFDAVATQLEREPRALPELVIHGKHDSIEDFKYEDFELKGYDPHPLIKAKVSV